MIIPFIIDGIIGLIPRLPGSRIFSGNNGPLADAELKMLMFDNPCVGNFPFRIINHRISLIIITFRHIFLLKAQGAVFQVSKAIIKIFVYHARIKDFVIRDKIPPSRSILLLLSAKLPVICPKHYLRAFQHFADNRRIAPYWDSLVPVGKIIVIICKAERNPLYNKSRQLPAASAPLLLRIALDQFLIYIASGQRQCLFFKILRFPDRQRLNLRGDLRPGLGGRSDSPEPAECIHIKRKIINLLPVYRHGGVHKMIELCKAIHVIPYFRVRCMENMGPILMYMDSPLYAGIDITGYMLSFINHQAGSPMFFHLM